MADISITVRDNGPYLIRGGATITDAEGKTFETEETIALCRCGHSDRKPFCDGKHKATDFHSTPRVPS